MNFASSPISQRVQLKKKTQRHFLRAFFECQQTLRKRTLERVEDKLKMAREQQKIHVILDMFSNNTAMVSRTGPASAICITSQPGLSSACKTNSNMRGMNNDEKAKAKGLLVHPVLRA
ncbi:uncharacterized protein HKW66_Vig0155330 [Vigna angularis]|uniref:Uncharacterized protein n=1 Tax=Phaseolus angularis TaxID=3914 RepID=A0A8T0JN19_PHAAN|nr:uncharacterized protein HKW66_Vig0155330 [Vigna angularis]